MSKKKSSLPYSITFKNTNGFSFVKELGEVFRKVSREQGQLTVLLIEKEPSEKRIFVKI